MKKLKSYNKVFLTYCVMKTIPTHTKIKERKKNERERKKKDKKVA